MEEKSEQYPAPEQQNIINTGLYQHVLITYLVCTSVYQYIPVLFI
jgi:hypothetical protein